MRNIEIKARPRDWTRIETALTDLGAEDAGRETQTDIFYACRDGRLKLRLSDRSGATLIHYRRDDTAEVRRSEYVLLPLSDGEAARGMLESALEVVGTVRKERHLRLLDNVRIHCDHVDGLGRFLEIEAIVDAAHPEPRCRARVEELLESFGIAPADHLAAAYTDLLSAKRPQTELEAKRSTSARTVHGLAR